MVTHTEIGQYVIIMGNVIEGVILIGPFTSRLKARDYAIAHASAAWTIGEMLAPNSREGRLP